MHFKESNGYRKTSQWGEGGDHFKSTGESHLGLTTRLGKRGKKEKTDYTDHTEKRLDVIWGDVSAKKLIGSKLTGQGNGSGTTETKWPI